MRNLAPQLERAVVTLPRALASRVGPPSDIASRLRVDVTPKYTLLDLRIEHGVHIVATGVAAEQIWFLFPPTVSFPPSPFAFALPIYPIYLAHHTSHLAHSS
jgi:hypothetical protein